MSRSPEIDAILQLHRSGRVIEDREAHALAAEVERLEEAHVEAMCCLAKHAREAAHQKQRAEAAEARVARMTEMLLAYDAERALYLRRLLWLHDCSTGTTDADGCEWGIYRVKWVNGQAIEVWQTNSDFSDLDAAIERDGYKLPASAKVLEARVKELEALEPKRAQFDSDHCMHVLVPHDKYEQMERAETRLRELQAGDYEKLEAQNARLRAALEDVSLLAHCISKAGPLNTPDLETAWRKFDLISVKAAEALVDRKAALNGEEASK